MAEKTTFDLSRSSLFTTDGRVPTLHIGARPKRETGRFDRGGIAGAVRIKPMERADVSRLGADCDVPDVAKRLSYYPAPTLRAHLDLQYREHALGNDFMWIADDDEGTLGWFGLYADQGHDEGLEFGVFLHPRARSTRVLEIATYLCQHAADVVARQLVAVVERDNVRSQGAIKKGWPDVVAEDFDSGYASCVLFRLDGPPLNGLLALDDEEQAFCRASLESAGFTGWPVGAALAA